MGEQSVLLMGSLIPNAIEKGFEREIEKVMEKEQETRQHHQLQISHRPPLYHPQPPPDGRRNQSLGNSEQDHQPTTTQDSLTSDETNSSRFEGQSPHSYHPSQCKSSSQTNHHRNLHPENPPCDL
jgi:hypothetical protein